MIFMCTQWFHGYSVRACAKITRVYGVVCIYRIITDVRLCVVLLSVHEWWYQPKLGVHHRKLCVHQRDLDIHHRCMSITDSCTWITYSMYIFNVKDTSLTCFVYHTHVRTLAPFTLKCTLVLCTKFSTVTILIIFFLVVDYLDIYVDLQNLHL